MLTAIDTNVLSEVFGGGPAVGVCTEALAHAARQGRLVISMVVYTELAAGLQDATPLRGVLDEMGIEVDSLFPEAAAFLAAAAWRRYTVNRAKHRSEYHCPGCGHVNRSFSCVSCGRPIVGGPRHVLADFYVAAHALASGAMLLTSERRGGLYRSYFPDLSVVMAQ